MSSEDSWEKYNSAGSAARARPRLLKTLETFFPLTKGRALDIGCGGGRDTRELLAKGWSVDAVDNDDSTIHLMEKLKEQWPNNLRVIRSAFEDLVLDESSYDLINASFSLPFCQPTYFTGFFAQLKKSLRPNGIISCDLFGNNDSWNTKSESKVQLTFLNRAEVETLASDLIIESLGEIERDLPSFAKKEKHWHIFELVGRLRAQ